MVPKKTAEAWMSYTEQHIPVTYNEAHEYALQAAEKAYCAVLEELGISWGICWVLQCRGL
jgi:hypothetical protein